MPFSTILVVSAFGFGFLSGVMSGARHTALVYLAENAHRRPETVQGWYFYNKTKYYRMMMGGVKQGSRTGLKLTGWVGGWCLLDVLSEDARKYLAEKQQESEMPHGSSVISKLGHWSDGALAGAVTGLIGSIAYRLSSPTVPRMLLLGAVAGGASGALRDIRLSLMRGQDPRQQRRETL